MVDALPSVPIMVYDWLVMLKTLQYLEVKWSPVKQKTNRSIPT